jgi:hypothetical protein
MFPRRQAISIAILIGLTAIPTFGQNTLYFHDFNGAAGVPLHGTAADINATGLTNTWVTRTDTGQVTGIGQLFFADGTINGSSGGVNGSATLAFTPQSGFIYTLTASFNEVTSTGNNWVALGFTEGQTSAGSNNPGRFIGPGGTAGQPWMLYRGTGANQADQTFLGPGTGLPAVEWPTPVTASRGAPVDLRIILDTTNPAWSAQWQAKNPADATFTTVRNDVYATNPTIGGVGIAIANTDIMTQINSFRLETNGPTFTPGDVNGDGLVNLLDFNSISDNFFNTPATRPQGDLDGNIAVDFADFRLWKSLKSGSGTGASPSVPEPAAGMIANVALACVLCARRRRQRAA